MSSRLLPRDKKYPSALTALSIPTATELYHTSGFQSRLITIHTACQIKHKHGCYKMDDGVLWLSLPTSALDGSPVRGGTLKISTAMAQVESHCCDSDTEHSI